MGVLVRLFFFLLQSFFTGFWLKNFLRSLNVIVQVGVPTLFTLRTQQSLLLLKSKVIFQMFMKCKHTLNFCASQDLKFDTLKLTTNSTSLTCYFHVVGNH